MVQKSKRVVTIGRNKTQPTESSAPLEQPKTTSIINNGIALASPQIAEDNPFKTELLKSGYVILSENEYGVVARQDKGKPTFIPLTASGYEKATERNTLVLPITVDTAMKMRAASMRMSVMQYLTQLVIKDLRDNNLL